MIEVERPSSWVDSIRPYLEKAPLAALALGISSGFPFAMIAATLTTRLKQDGITKATVTAFSLAILVYNFKWLWSWMVDGVRLPMIGRMGQRVSWMLLAGVMVIAAVSNLAFADPKASIGAMAVAAILVGIAGATFDTVIDAYRIELLEPRQLGVGSGMAQYGYRIGNVGAASLALLIAGVSNWTAAYMTCCVLALPAMLTAVVIGEPARRRAPAERRSVSEVLTSIWGPFVEFFERRGALIVLIFILVHKVGDTLANLTFRLLFDDLKFTNAEIAGYDVLLGFWAYMIGIFIGGILYAKIGMKYSVLLSLVLMAVSNLSFAALAAAGHSNLGMAAAIGFENIASGFGGVVVTAYFSALTDLRFTAAQYALISAAASILGRVLTGTMAGGLIDRMGYVDFYILTTIIALPGVLIFWWMIRSGLVDQAIGSAATESSELA
jgi:PAT family beta-lactamase induction signal transducer AmpG